eukprot:14841324-Alexandrium_andersonii.AAC.1
MDKLEVRRVYTDDTTVVVQLRTADPRPAATNRAWRGEKVYLWPSEASTAMESPPEDSSELESSESE